MWIGTPVGSEREFSSRDLANDLVKSGRPSSRRASITAQQFCSISIGGNLVGPDGISKTTVWKKYACTRELRRCENVPDSACWCQLARGAFVHPYAQHMHKRRRIDAHRAGCSADGGCSPQTLRRHRARGALADRGTGGAGKRRHTFCEWRFADLGKTRRDLAEGVAPRRIRPRSQCV